MAEAQRRQRRVWWLIAAFILAPLAIAAIWLLLPVRLF
jgi:hypothetical protein